MGRNREHESDSARAKASMERFVAAGGKRKCFRLSAEACKRLAELKKQLKLSDETKAIERLIMESK